MGDLDLDGVALVAGLVLPRALDELAGHQHAVASVERLAGVLGDGAPCGAAEEAITHVLPLPVVPAAVADCDGEACEVPTTNRDDAS
jgi:hypothetical protein